MSLNSDDDKSGFTVDFQLPKDPLLDSIDRIFQGIKDLNSHSITNTKILTFGDVIRYFKTKTPKVLGIKKAAMHKTIHPRGYLIVLFFLNNEEKIATDEEEQMYGRIILAQEIDNELQKAFGKKDLVILK